MRELLILLGAGASKVFGIPTMVEFIDAVLDNLETEPRKLAEECMSNLRSWSDGQSRIADLEGLLLALRARAGPDGLGNSWPHLAAFQMNPPTWDSGVVGTALLAVRQVEDSIGKICRRFDREKAADLYNELFTGLTTSVRINRQTQGVGMRQAVSKNRLAANPERIFTTNYDLGVEMFLRKYGYPYSDGFKIDNRSGDLTLQMDWGSPDGQFQLFKLHGSIDYYRDGEGRIVRLPGPPQDQFLGEKYLGQLMIFPAEENYVTRSPFHDLFLMFRDWLKRDMLTVVIGSSLRDQPIRNAIEDVIPSIDPFTRPVKLVIVAPRASQIVSTFSERVKRNCVAMNAKFGSPGFVNELNRAISEVDVGQTIDYLR